VRVIAVSHLKDFWHRHAGAEPPLRSWVASARAAQWARPADITAQFTTASVLESRRLVFNIKGNDYRLVVAVAYRFGAVCVKFVGTHAEYDHIDADTVEMP
jgi:mRNA interferase HigB